MAPQVIVFAEQREGRLRRAAQESLCEARRLANQLGGEVGAVVVGSGVRGLAAEVASFGADRVYLFDHAALLSYATETYARALSQVVTESKATIVLLPFTSQGKDLAPRVAARVGAGLASDCVALSLTDGKLEARRPVYAGKAFATIRFAGEPQMATLRPNVFALGAPDASRKAQVVEGQVDTTTRARVTAVEAIGGGRVELSEAQIIVAGGRGLKGPEHFHLVEELAGAFGAAVGATRAVVDAGWVGHSIQVGQTGKTVSPQLYLACGISGAIQHLAGMATSKTIVAVNKDPEAPIFKVANYGVVGDVFDVLPRLTKAASSYFSSKG
jgi:electron transfer flavoprotein alpha subunit